MYACQKDAETIYLNTCLFMTKDILPLNFNNNNNNTFVHLCNMLWYDGILVHRQIQCIFDIPICNLKDIRW